MVERAHHQVFAHVKLDGEECVARKVAKYKNCTEKNTINHNIIHMHNFSHLHTCVYEWWDMHRARNMLLYCTLARAYLPTRYRQMEPLIYITIQNHKIT